MIDDEIAYLKTQVRIQHDAILVLQKEIEKLTEAFGTALVWIVSSANSPLRQDEVEQLIKMMK